MARERDLFANFERMRREIDELFGDVFGRLALPPHRRGAFAPPVDVAYAEDPPRAVVTAALPGVRLDELELEIRGRQLRIAGRRRPTAPQGRVYQQIEIEHGPFQRVIELGAEVDRDRIRATLEDGLLQVELPLAPPDQARRQVSVQPGSRAGERAPAVEREASGPEGERAR